MTAGTEKDMAARFKRDTANHGMTVLHDDGLYRHLRFADPKSSFYWFEIITWPGSLTVRGDCGGFMFSRVTDMFEFFRSNGNTHGVNPGYWAEKMPDGGRSVRVYSEDKLRAEVAEAITAYEAEYPNRKGDHAAAKDRYDAAHWADRWPTKSSGPRDPGELKSPTEVRQIVTDHDEDGLLSFADGARLLLSELETAGVVSDTFEWDLTDWDWQYLWCCHAIVSAVRQYDGKLAPRQVVTVDALAEAAA